MKIDNDRLVSELTRGEMWEVGFRYGMGFLAQEAAKIIASGSDPRPLLEKLAKEHADAQG